ncbi:MAG: hypothetical protein H6713_14140 [Myxococcales bacterium]|nr:hypothetical protein [Myxococcales bacterium]
MKLGALALYTAAGMVLTSMTVWTMTEPASARDPAAPLVAAATLSPARRRPPPRARRTRRR